MATSRKNIQLLQLPVKPNPQLICEVIECPKCKEILTHPRSLGPPCMHSFCQRCLQKEIKPRPYPCGYRVWCPICITFIPIPTERSDDLPKNQFIDSLVDMISHIARRDMNVRCKKCNNIGPPLAEKHCVNCQMMLCRNCSFRHGQSHEHEIRGVSSIGGNSVDVERLQAAADKCMKCNQAVCFQCLRKLVACASHEVHEALEDERERIKAKPSQLNGLYNEGNSLKQSEEKGKRCLEEVERTKRDIESYYRESMDNIRMEMNKLLKYTDTIRQETVTQLKRVEDAMKEEARDQADISEALERCSTAAGYIYHFGTILDERISSLRSKRKELLTGQRWTKLTFVRHDPFSHPETQQTKQSSGIFGRIEEVVDQASGSGTDTEEDREQEEKERGQRRKRIFNSQQTTSSTDDSSDRSRIAGETSKEAENHLHRDSTVDEDDDIPEDANLRRYIQFLNRMKTEIEAKKTVKLPPGPILNQEDFDQTFQSFSILDPTNFTFSEDEWSRVVLKHVCLLSSCQQFISKDAQFKKRNSSPDNVLEMLHQMSKDIEELKRKLITSHRSYQENWKKRDNGKMLTSDNIQNKVANRRPNGIRNLGNTCYLNVVMQCLCHSHLLLVTGMKSLSGEQMNRHPTSRDSVSLTDAFLQFLYQGYDRDSRQEYIDQLLKALYKNLPKYADHSQQDSHHLLIQLLNDLRTEEKDRLKKPRGGGGGDCLTIVDKVFGGHFVTVYYCQGCEQPYVVCESFLDVSLPISCPDAGQNEDNTCIDSSDFPLNALMTPLQSVDPPASSYSSSSAHASSYSSSSAHTSSYSFSSAHTYSTPYMQPTISKCLQHFTRMESIVDEYLCLHCQKKPDKRQKNSSPEMMTAFKRTLIYDPPAILVIHLKRFQQMTHGFSKNDAQLGYEELLDLGPYCCSGVRRLAPEDENIWYSLYGVIVHSGSLEGGHYHVYIKCRQKMETSEEFLQTETVDKNNFLEDKREKERVDKQLRSLKNKWKPENSIPGKWYHISDDYVLSVGAREALSQNAFLLFYERLTKY